MTILHRKKYLLDSHSRNGQNPITPERKLVLLNISKLDGIQNYMHVVPVQERSEIHNIFKFKMLQFI